MNPSDDSIKNDRMWTTAKKHRNKFNELYDKVCKGIRLTDSDMSLVKYSLILAFCELQRRHCEDLTEEQELNGFGIDNPPSE